MRAARPITVKMTTMMMPTVAASFMIENRGGDVEGVKFGNVMR